MSRAEFSVNQRRLPAGEASKINELVNSNPQEYLIGLVPVKNKVLWVNPAFDQLPFDLKTEESTPLGLFAKSPPVESKLVGEGWAKHHRSSLLSRIFIKDRENNLYRDIDLKGIGNIIYYYESNETKSVEPKCFIGAVNPGETLNRDNFNWRGLLHEEIAKYDVEFSEKLFSMGLRIVRPLALIKLDEIICDGEKISINDAKNKKIIDEAAIPVLEARAFGTRARIGDLLYDTSDQANRSKLLFEDAIKMVSEELGRKETISYEEYFGWFGRTLGESIGLMHKNHLCHHYLSTHNITLDCRLVDFDSMRDADKQSILEDTLRIYQTLDSFIDNFCVPRLVSYEKKSKYNYILKDNFHSVYGRKYFC
jgi:hypothetical protein